MRKRGFTLIELLVVISIIVILLALLVGGLERALKAAERGKCGANQRGLGQTCASYALEYDRTFPVAKRYSDNTAGGLESSTMLRAAVNAKDANAVKNNSYGLGNLMNAGRLPSSKGGEMLHCPTLDTSSGSPVKTGMDEEAATSDRGQPCSGASSWTSSNQRIHGGYNYRGMSYEVTHGNGTIRTNIANSSFVVTSDLISQTKDTAGRFGRAYHHLTGWNVSHGDGSASYVLDKNDAIRVNADGTTNGYVEQEVIGGQTKGFPGPSGYPNDAAQAAINGFTKPGADEAVFKFLGSR